MRLQEAIGWMRAELDLYDAAPDPRETVQLDPEAARAVLRALSRPTRLEKWAAANYGDLGGLANQNERAWLDAYGRKLKGAR